jgi:hypothetical protein
MDFILEPATTVKTSSDEPMILFCIGMLRLLLMSTLDVSGSMGVTTEVSGNFEFKGKSTTTSSYQQV